MKPIHFDEVTDVLAKDQPQYNPLPICRTRDDQGRVVFCWKLTWRERFRVLFGGVIWHQVLTFGSLLQPQKLTTKALTLGLSSTSCNAGVALV